LPSSFFAISVASILNTFAFVSGLCFPVYVEIGIALQLDGFIYFGYFLSVAEDFGAVALF